MSTKETHAALLAAALQIEDPEIRERAIERVLAGARRDGVVLERASNTELRNAGGGDASTTL